MTAKLQGNLGLQKNKVLLSQLSAFQFLLDDFYGSCRPSIDDYANRRDLIRIFNEITREMYGKLIFFNFLLMYMTNYFHATNASGVRV